MHPALTAEAPAAAATAALPPTPAAAANPTAARAAELFNRDLFLMAQRNSYESAQKASMTGAYPSLAERRQRRLEEASAAAAATGSSQAGPEIPLTSLVPYPLDTAASIPASPSRVAVHESTSILPPAAPILKPASPARWTSSLGLTLSPGSTAKAVSFAQQLEAVRNIPSRGSSYADDELDLLESVGAAEHASAASTKLQRKTPRPKKKKIKKPRPAHVDYDSSSISDRTPRHRKYTTDVEEDANEDEEHQSPLTAQLLAAAAQITLPPNDIPPLRASSPSLGPAPSPLRAPRSKATAMIEPQAKLSPTLTAAILEASEQAEVAYAAEQMQIANADPSSSLLMPSRLVALQQDRTALFARVASRRTASASSGSTSSSVSSLLSAGSGSSGSSGGSSSSGSISFASSQSSSTAHSPVISPALAPSRMTATVPLSSHSRYASQGYKQRSHADSLAGGRYMTSPAAINTSSAAAREREREMQRVVPAPYIRQSLNTSAVNASPPLAAASNASSADDTLSALSVAPTGKLTPSPPRADASPRGPSRAQQQQQQRGGGAPGDSVAVRSPRGAARLVRAAATGSAPARQGPRVASTQGSGTSGADAWLEQHARECADKQLRQQQHARASSQAASVPRSSFLFPSSPAPAAAAPLVSRSPKQGYAVSGPQGGFAMGIVGVRPAGSASVVGGSITGTAGWTPVSVASGVAPFAFGASSSSSAQLESRSRSNLPSPRGAASSVASAASSAAPRPASSLGLHSSSSCYVSPGQPQPKASSKRMSGPLAVVSSSSTGTGSWSFAR